MVHGPFVPWTVRSVELSFPEPFIKLSFAATNGPWIFPFAGHSFTGTFVSNYIASCESGVTFVNYSRFADYKKIKKTTLPFRSEGVSYRASKPVALS